MTALDWLSEPLCDSPEQSSAVLMFVNNAVSGKKWNTILKISNPSTAACGFSSVFKHMWILVEQRKQFERTLYHEADIWGCLHGLVV